MNKNAMSKQLQRFIEHLAKRQFNFLHILVGLLTYDYLSAGKVLEGFLAYAIGILCCTLIDRRLSKKCTAGAKAGNVFNKGDG